MSIMVSQHNSKLTIVQQQARSKENIKAQHYWLFVRETTGDWTGVLPTTI